MMRGFLTFSLSSVSAIALFAAPAFGQVSGVPVESAPAEQAEEQTPPAGAPTNAEGEPVSEGTIVVTGSRIRRNTYSTDAPIDLITKEDTVLAGARSTAEVLQSSTVTSGTAQISPTFLGFVSEGGPGANTVGLRGLGASRTLVLLNGRRLAPAGAGPELIAADLNVLPTGIVQRIEVLREGASSIYGSDAVAGVINVITETKLNGLTVDFYTNQPIQHGGGGRNYRGSLVWGKTFDRGHITASLEYRQTTGLRVGDRDDFSCPKDLFVNPATGEPAGHEKPDSTEPRCWPFQYETIGTAHNYILSGSFATGAVNRYSFPTGDLSQPLLVNDYKVRPLASPNQLATHVLSPVKTYTAYVNAAHEVGDDGLELYGEALFTQRRSLQTSSTQIAWDPNQTGRELYGGTFAGYTWEELGEIYGNPNYFTFPFFPDSIAAQGDHFARFFISPEPTTSRQKINFFRTNGGLRGDLGIKDWRFDTNLQYSRTKSRYSVEQIDVNKFNNAFTPVLAPAGTPDSVITVALPGQAGAGNAYTCASNVTDGAYNGGDCIPFNVFDPDVLAGNVPRGVLDYLYDEHVGHTTFQQWTAAAIIDGSLFELPAGPVKFAVGGEYRRDKIRDVPSEAAQAGTLYNFSSAGITAGKDRVIEVFGELDVPILRDKPFFHELSVNGSARFTNYKSYGSQWTYRAGAQWAPISNIRFRANYGTAFRAPNLFEQFVANQTGFFAPSADPCDDFVQKSSPGEPLYDNCLAQVGAFFNSDIDGDGINDNFIATSGPQVTVIGGAGILDAEKSKSWGLGAVFTAPQSVGDLTFAIDYFNIVVNGQVSRLGTNILDFCYEAEDFPTNQFCSFISPREQTQGNLTAFNDPYINIAMQKATGIDFSGRFARDMLGGKFATDVRVTRMLKQIIQNFPNEDPFDYNGLLGYQGTTGGPKWVGSLDLRYSRGPWTVRWGVEYVGKMNTGPFVEAAELEDGTVVDTDLEAEPYWEHGVSVRYTWKDVGQFTLGVNNLFDQKPSTISSHTRDEGQFPRIGNYFNYSGYDFIGRSVFLNVTRSF